MTNVDCVGKVVIGQRTAVIVFSCGSSTHIKRSCPWNKWTEQTNVISVRSTNKTKFFNVELLLKVKLVNSGNCISLINFDA